MDSRIGGRYAADISLRAIAAVLVANELLTSVTLRDVSLGSLVLNFNYQMLQLCNITDVSVLICIFQFYQD